MKVLHLTLKKKWFDMIASGEKKEEYREVKKYWVSKLVDELDLPHSNSDFNFLWHDMSCSMGSPEAYDYVSFRNGYSKNAPMINVKIHGIDIGYGKEEWGAEYGKPYFVIKLGEIIAPLPT